DRGAVTFRDCFSKAHDADVRGLTSFRFVLKNAVNHIGHGRAECALAFDGMLLHGVELFGRQISRRVQTVIEYVSANCAHLSALQTSMNKTSFCYRRRPLIVVSRPSESSHRDTPRRAQAVH